MTFIIVPPHLREPTDSKYSVEASCSIFELSGAGYVSFVKDVSINHHNSWRVHPDSSRQSFLYSPIAPPDVDPVAPLRPKHVRVGDEEHPQATAALGLAVSEMLLTDLCLPQEDACLQNCATMWSPSVAVRAGPAEAALQRAGPRPRKSELTEQQKAPRAADPFCQAQHGCSFASRGMDDDKRFAALLVDCQCGTARTRRRHLLRWHGARRCPPRRAAKIISRHDGDVHQF